MNTGPSFSIVNNAEMFLKLGELGKAAAEAEKGIKDAEKAAQRAQAKLGNNQFFVPSQKMQDYVKSLEKIQMQATAGLAAQDAIESSKDRLREDLHEAHITEKLGMKFQRVFGGTFMQKLIKGEPLEFGDAIREVRGAEKLTEKVLRTAGVTNISTLLNAGILIKVGAEAFEAWDRAIKQIDQERKDAESVGRKFGRGLISESEFEFFQKRHSSIFGGGDAAKDVKNAEKLADSFGNIQQDKFAKILEPAIKINFGHTSGFFTNEAVRKLMEEAIEKRTRELQSALTKDEQKAVQRKVIEGISIDLPTSVIDKIIESLEKAEADLANDEAIKNKQKPLYLVYQEKREKEIYQAQAAIADKRYPAMPTD